MTATGFITLLRALEDGKRASFDFNLHDGLRKLQTAFGGEWGDVISFFEDVETAEPPTIKA